MEDNENNRQKYLLYATVVYREKDRLFPSMMMLYFNVAAYSVLICIFYKLIKVQNLWSNSLVYLISHIYQNLL